jgi:hypothetical protein
MKKIVALGLLLFIVFVVVNRQRLFLRDPLASVTRDGVTVHGAQVMINYSNDVLLSDASSPHRSIYLVQHWNKVAETPTAPLHCLQAMACLTDADQAAGAAIVPGTRGRRTPFAGVTMTNKRIEFVDEDGALVEVTLR